jgi:hypothetical protein
VLSVTPSDARAVAERRLAAGLESVARGQHPRGELLSFRRDADGNYAYVRSPFLSTFVHDALACLDPTSPGWHEGGVDLFPERLQGRLLRGVLELRRRTRGYLIWQQEAEGWWRFFGRGSGVDPDVNSTACASLALLEGHSLHSPLRRQRQRSLVLSFRSADGPFFTFLKPGWGGYGWLSDSGVPVVGFDRVVNAEVLHFLGRIDGGSSAAAAALAEWLLDQAATAGPATGSPLYPNPVCFPYVLARALEAPGVPRRQALTAAALGLLLRQQRADGGFGGPLSTAMGASALLTLGHRGPELAAARLAVLRCRGANDSWPYEDFVVHGFGAPAWTTALSIAFLVRHSCAAAGAAA